MKKCLLLFIFLSSFTFLNAENEKEAELKKTREAFQRLFESAHPKPAPQAEYLFYVPLQNEENKSSVFLNVNTIEDESGSNQMQNESSIAVNPTNPLNLIAAAVDYRDNSSTKVYVSHDGGKTWENHFLGRPYDGWRSTNDPSVMFDLDGTGYLVYGGTGRVDGYQIGENGFFIARTTDEGKTWEAHKVVKEHRGQLTLADFFEDKYYIAVDKGPASPHKNTLYIPWKRVTPLDSATHIVMSRSRDKGDTWSDAIPISHRLAGTSEDTTFGQSFPLIACGPEGNVYCVWNHGIVKGVGFAMSTDGGDTFTDPQILHHYKPFGTTTLIPNQGYRHTVKGKVRAEAYPVIATDVTGGSRNGNVYVCWAADSIPNIYFSKSTNQGQDWSDPIIVHSDTTNDQFWPWMAVDPKTGDLAIMYFDSRNDAGNIMVECYVSYSNDGGDTWIDRKAADMASDLRLNPFQYNAFAGDYSGVDFFDGIIYPSWVDMRNAVDNIRDSDVYTAVVNIHAPNPPHNLSLSYVEDDPKKIIAKWDMPTERAFGQAMSADEFKYTLEVNGEEQELNSDVITLDISELTLFDMLQFKIKTVADLESVWVVDSARVGDGFVPKMPTITEIQNVYDQNILKVGIPSSRKNEFTKITNLSDMIIYRNGQEVQNIELTQSDTASIVSQMDPVTPGRYYVYNVAVSEEYEQYPDDLFISEQSEKYIIYSGNIEQSLSEEFSDTELKHYSGSGWEITNEFFKSSPNCITESVGGKYDKYENDTLLLTPVALNYGGNGFIIEFWHACLVASNDDAIVEYSVNNGEWKKLANFNEKDYDYWSDDVLDNNDWKHEEFALVLPEDDDTLHIRFIFSSNQLKEEDGWYIDDIQLNPAAISVEEKIQERDFDIYPLPAREEMNLHFSGLAFEEIKSVNIIDLFGNQYHVEYIPTSGNSIRVNCNNFSSGTYFVNIILENGNNIIKKANILK